jgi:hypothetical protein
MSTCKIDLKNQYFKHLLGLKGTVQQVNRKTEQVQSNHERIDIELKELQSLLRQGMSGS